MYRRNSRLSLQVLAACWVTLLFAGCASQVTKDEKDEKVDRRKEKIGAEDFMPERVRVIYVRSCASCHGPDGHGVAAVAPDLYRAKYRPREEWEKYLRDSADAHPVTHPPPLWLNEDEMKNMAEYLESATWQNQ
ncbi:MAG TPA: cytochrome c [Blastocatellia bacterium]|nr:cytochrome c [Blastocatellia bacterium]